MFDGQRKTEQAKALEQKEVKVSWSGKLDAE
jgi:hypothetical protein